MAARSGEETRRQAAVLAAVHAFRRTFADLHRRLAAASGDEVSLADAFALQFVAHTPDATPGAIAQFTGLTSGAVSTMLDRLEGAGFVTRARSPRDKRSVLVRLAPGAHQRLMAVMLEAHRDLGRMFDGWSAKEIEDLVGRLERLKPA